MMKKINLVFDECYEDADILLVPDFVFNTADAWSSKYGNWLVSQGEHVMESKGFVEWLNKFYCTENNKACILQQHITVDPDEKAIEF